MVDHLPCPTWLKKETRTERDIYNPHDRKRRRTCEGQEPRDFCAKWHWWFKSFVVEILFESVSSEQLTFSSRHSFWVAKTIIIKLGYQYAHPPFRYAHPLFRYTHLPLWYAHPLCPNPTAIPTFLYVVLRFQSFRSLRVLAELSLNSRPHVKDRQAETDKQTETDK